MRTASAAGLSLVVAATLLSLMAPGVIAANDAGGPMIVDLKAPATPAQLAALEAAGLNGVHGYDHLPVAAGNLPQGRIANVMALGFVVGVRADGLRTPTSVEVASPSSATSIPSTWWLDFMDREGTTATGAGVYVALLDAGLVPQWRDFLDESRVRIDLGRSFTGHNGNPVPDQLENDRNGHGMATAATIIGYKLHDKSETGQFFPTPVTDAPGEYRVPGVAPLATIIPIKVCDVGVYCWDSSIYSGWDYVMDLKGGLLKDSPIVINMSLGGSSHSTSEENLIKSVVAMGILVVASAGNDGPNPMGWPGAYPVVISAGAGGWRKQFYGDEASLNNRWTFDDVPEGTAAADDWFMVWWTGKEYPSLGQQLDVVAPGRFMLLPYLPNGKATPSADPTPPDGVPSPYFYISGTSFSAPATTGVVALMLSVNPTLTQAQVEAILRSTALPLPADCWTAGFPYPHANCWDASKSLGGAGSMTGWGLVQADGAVAAAMSLKTAKH